MLYSTSTVQLLYYPDLTREICKEVPLESVCSVSTSITEETRKLMNYLREKNCEIKNEMEIKDFLLRQPNLIYYIRGAIIQIYKYYKLRQKTTLELIFDPEIEGNEELFINIETDLEPEEALLRLDKIDKEWFLPVVSHNVQNFNLNIEFQ